VLVFAEQVDEGVDVKSCTFSGDAELQTGSKQSSRDSHLDYCNSHYIDRYVSNIPVKRIRFEDDKQLHFQNKSLLQIFNSM